MGNQSIFKDQNLINALLAVNLKQAKNVVDKELQKVAQDAATYNKALTDIAKSLVNRLSEEGSDKPESGALNAAGTPANIGVSELSNIPNYIAFLGQEKVLFNNKLVVYFKSETFQDVKDSSEQFVPEADRKSYKAFPTSLKNLTYFYNPELLKNYTTSLLKEAQESDNKLFILMMGNLINDLNSQLKLGITGKTDGGKKLDEDLAVDYLPKLINLTNNKEKGPIALKLQNLKDSNAFSIFVFGNNFQITDGKAPAVKLEDADHFCKLLNYLHERAKALLSTASLEAKEYVARVEKLASETSCALTGEKVSNQKQTDSGEGGTGTGDGKDSQIVWPLVQGALLKSPLTNFITSMNGYIKANPKFAEELKSTNIAQLFNDLDTSEKELASQMGGNWGAVDLKGSASEVAERAFQLYKDQDKNKKVKGTMQLLDAALTLIETVNSIMMQLKETSMAAKQKYEYGISNQLSLAKIQTYQLQQAIDVGIKYLNQKVTGKFGG